MCGNPQGIFIVPFLTHRNQFGFTVITIKRKLRGICTVCGIYVVPQQIIHCRGLILAGDKGCAIVHQCGLVKFLCQIEHTKAANGALVTIMKVIHITTGIAKIHLILGEAVHALEADNIVRFAKRTFVSGHFIA